MKYDSCIHIEGVGPVLTPLFPRWAPNVEWCMVAGIKYMSAQLFSQMHEVEKFKVFTLTKGVTAEYLDRIICQIYLIDDKIMSYKWLLGFETEEEIIIYHLSQQ